MTGLTCNQCSKHSRTSEEILADWSGENWDESKKSMEQGVVVWGQKAEKALSFVWEQLLCRLTHLSLLCLVTATYKKMLSLNLTAKVV